MRQINYMPLKSGEYLTTMQWISYNPIQIIATLKIYIWNFPVKCGDIIYIYRNRSLNKTESDEIQTVNELLFFIFDAIFGLIFAFYIR